MPKLKATWNTLQHLVRHEANKEQPLGPLKRFIGWQILKRANNEPITIDAFGGGRLRCYPENSPSNAVVYFGWPDWAEMQLLRELLRTDDTFFDIGANVGVYSVLASTLVGSNGQVLAFEPDPINAEKLRANFLLNDLPVDDVHQVAVGEESGTRRFANNKGSIGSLLPDGAVNGIDVVCKKLDDIISDPIGTYIAKVDVEGFELGVMKGASELLASHSIKAMIIETNDCCKHLGQTRAELQKFLNEFGYSFFGVDVSADGIRLDPIPLEGAYPSNSLALCDLDWIKQRVSGIIVN